MTDEKEPVEPEQSGEDTPQDADDTQEPADETPQEPGTADEATEAEDADKADEAEADEAGPDEAGKAEESGSKRITTPVLIGLLVALLLGISGGVAWWSAAHSEDLEAASDRDAVLVAAKQHIATLNTLDYRKVDAGLKAWTSVTTGTLKDQFSSISADDRKLLADQKKISTGKVVDAAVLEVDGASARVIASVEVEVRDGKDLSKDPSIKRNRFSADLTRSGGTWKLDTLQQVAVDLS